MLLETEYYVACGDIGNGSLYGGNEIKQQSSFERVLSVYYLFIYEYKHKVNKKKFNETTKEGTRKNTGALVQ